MTIDSYLQVLPNYTFPDTFVQKALLKYGVASGMDAGTVTEMDRDLMEAVMWDYASGLVSGGGSSLKIDNRSMSSSSFSASSEDRAMWANKAAALRRKWGVSDDSEINVFEDCTWLWR